MNGIAYYHSPVGELIIESRLDKIVSVNFLNAERLNECLTPVINQQLKLF